MRGAESSFGAPPAKATIGISAAPDYNRLIVAETDSTHWVVETKMNKEMSTETVKSRARRLHGAGKSASG